MFEKEPLWYPILCNVRSMKLNELVMNTFISLFYVVVNILVKKPEKQFIIFSFFFLYGFLQLDKNEQHKKKKFVYLLYINISDP